MGTTIKSSADIDEVFKSGTRFSSGLVSIIIKETSNKQRGQEGRVAYIAAKRLGNAVTRNRNKRVLRAVARDAGLPCPGYDVVMLATRRTGAAGHEDVVSALRRLLGKAGVR